MRERRNVPAPRYSDDTVQGHRDKREAEASSVPARTFRPSVSSIGPEGADARELISSRYCSKFDRRSCTFALGRSLRIYVCRGAAGEQQGGLAPRESKDAGGGGHVPSRFQLSQFMAGREPFPAFLLLSGRSPMQ